MSAIWAGALLTVYLAITGALLLIAHQRVSSAGIVIHFGVLGIIVAATWATFLPSWMRLWAPLIVLLFLYSELPILIEAAGHSQSYDSAVVQWEQALFKGQPAREWAQMLPSRLVSEALHGAYLSYYAIIYSVPLVLQLRGQRAELAEAVFSLMAIYVVCFTWYIVFPVAGPRYFWQSPADDVAGPLRELTIRLLDARASRGTAFPSSHVSVAVGQSLLAVRYFGARGLVVGLLTFGLALGAIYGGFHYAIDVVVGALLGAACTAVALRFYASFSRRHTQAKASAPT